MRIRCPAARCSSMPRRHTAVLPIPSSPRMSTDRATRLGPDHAREHVELTVASNESISDRRERVAGHQRVTVPQGRVKLRRGFTQPAGELGARADTELAVHPRQARFDRRHAHEEGGGDLAVALTRDDAIGDIPLIVGEDALTVAWRDLLQLGASRAAPTAQLRARRTARSPRTSTVAAAPRRDERRNARPRHQHARAASRR